jgi:hypothetical protein
LRIGLVQQLELVQGCNFISGISNNFAHGIIKKGKVAAWVYLVVPIRGGLDNRPKLLLTFPQRSLGCGALVDGKLGMGTKYDEQA